LTCLVQAKESKNDYINFYPKSINFFIKKFMACLIFAYYLVLFDGMYHGNFGKKLTKAKICFRKAD
jgi:hypothetical protein